MCLLSIIILCVRQDSPSKPRHRVSACQAVFFAKRTSLCVCLAKPTDGALLRLRMLRICAFAHLFKNDVFLCATPCCIVHLHGFAVHVRASRSQKSFESCNITNIFLMSVNKTFFLSKNSSASGRTRTCYLQIRSLALYPGELRTLVILPFLVISETYANTGSSKRCAVALTEACLPSVGDRKEIH